LRLLATPFGQGLIIEEKTDPLPAMLGDFSDPKEELMFSKPRRDV